MCFGRLRRTHAVVEAAVATMVPRTQAILRALLRRCFSGSRAAIALRRQRTAALLQRCCRAARRRNRWSSRSLLMRDGVKAPASASIRALFASAQFFYFGRAKPSQNGFYRRRVKATERTFPLSRESLYCCHCTLSDGGGDGGVSRARSAARDICRSHSSVFVNGCAPPRTRRAILSVFSPVVTASRRSSSVASSSW